METCWYKPSTVAQSQIYLLELSNLTALNLTVYKLLGRFLKETNLSGS